MYKNLLLLLIFSLLLLACNKDEHTDPVSSQVDLVNLEVGQKSFYRSYKATCSDGISDFAWRGTTLILEVTENDGQLFFEESFTDDSAINIPPVSYPVTVIDGGILIPDRDESLLFYFYANDTIRLNPEHDVILEQDGCFVIQDSTPFVGNDIGTIPLFQVGEVRETNKTIVSCEPFAQLDGYLIYDNHLRVSHVIYMDVFDSTVSGWHLLE